MTKNCRWTALLLSFAMLISLLPLARSQAAESEDAQMAREISGASLITDKNGYYNVSSLFDGDVYTTLDGGTDSYLTLTSEEGIGSVYLVFGIEPGIYTVINNDNGESRTWGEENFLHAFLDIEEAFGAAPKSITIQFNEEKLLINELRAFTSGKVPDTVQRWNVPTEEGMDLILFSTHGDDEQLFFAGVLPYYARELGYEVLVVYMTDHRNHTLSRVHEMLNGLWAVGVTNYPVLGSFPDFFTDTKNNAYSMFSHFGVTEEHITQYVVENIRRYKPKVAVGHDPLGEYSHGQHMVYSEVLQKAVQQTMNPEYFPESAEKYGLWDVPKTYLHLYEENPIFMNWDQPLESFDGKTAFEVSKELGFACHVSQLKDFSWYLSQGKTAAEFRKYNPCEYGLFRSTVGEDVQKNEFFENLLSYEQERVAAEEEAARLEAERLAEEEARKQAEAEAAEKLRIEAEEKALAEQQEAERVAQETARRKGAMLWAACGAAALLVLIILIVLLVFRKRKHYTGRY